MTRPSDDDAVLTTGHVAALADCSREAVRAAIHGGCLSASRRGEHGWFRVDELDAREWISLREHLARVRARERQERAEKPPSEAAIARRRRHEEQARALRSQPRPVLERWHSHGWIKRPVARSLGLEADQCEA